MIWETVKYLETRKCQIVDLCDEIFATFNVERNREKLSETDSGKQLLEIVSQWQLRYKRILGE